MVELKNGHIRKNLTLNGEPQRFSLGTQKKKKKEEEEEEVCFVLLCRLLTVPATGKCISGTDLLRQFYVLPY